MNQPPTTSPQMSLFDADAQTLPGGAGLQSMSFTDLLGVCQVYARYHHQWPQSHSPESEFVEAGIHGAVRLGIDGPAINVLLQSSSPTLQSDTRYRQLQQRTLLENNAQITIADLDPQSRLSMESAMLRRVLHSVTAVASRNFDHQHSDPTHLELILPGAVIERVYAMAAITTAELRKRALDIRFMVPGAGDIASFISSTTMAGGNYSSQLGQHYYLKLVDDNSFLLGCHKILGGRSIGDVPPELIQAMVDHIGPQLLAALHQSTGSVLHTTLEANSQRRGAKIDDHLRDEIAQLVVTTQGVELPAVRLHFYKHIKKLLEKAGGRYVQNRQYFEFDDGIDTTTLIDRLLNGEQINRQKETQFFATPRSEALELCRQAGPLRGLRVLEPSAGSGAIADVIMEQSPGELVTIENDHVNAIKLRAKGYAPIEQDFLQIKADDIGLFDAIIANPPFSNNRDIDHVMHMLTMLKPGGSLSVIMSMAWINGHQRQHLEFKQLLAAHQIEPVPIEAGTFSASGTKVATVRIEFNNFQPDLSPPPALAPARGKRLRI